MAQFNPDMYDTVAERLEGQQQQAKREMWDLRQLQSVLESDLRENPRRVSLKTWDDQGRLHPVSSAGATPYCPRRLTPEQRKHLGVPLNPVPSTHQSRQLMSEAGAGGGDGDDRSDGDDERDPEWSSPLRRKPSVLPLSRNLNRSEESSTDRLENAVAALFESQQALLNQTQHNQTAGLNQSAFSDSQFKELSSQLQTIAGGSSMKTIESIPIYDGKDPKQSLEWLNEVENTCAQFGYDPLHTATLRSCGPVRQILGKYRAGAKWSEIRGKLVQQFSPYPTVHHVTAALHEMCQGSEGLETYVQRYTGLYQLADFTDMYNVASPTTISDFLRSLRNAKLAGQVQRRRPTSLGDAMDLAVRLEQPLQNEEALFSHRKATTSGGQPKVK